MSDRIESRNWRTTSRRRPGARRASLAALVAAVATPWAFAADPGPPAEANVAPLLATTELDPVEVRAHYENAVGTSDAASAGVIRGDLIQDIPLLRPGEALETVPGLVVTQHSGDGKANQYFLRGYNLDHGTDFATSLDGVPVNLPTNAHGQGYSDINYLIPELIESIEYRKGPYDASHGDFSAAGSADIHYRGSLDHGMLVATYGDDGYRRALIAASTPLAPGGGAAPGGAPVVLGALEGLMENGPWQTPEAVRKLNAMLRLSDGTKAHGWSVAANAYRAAWNATDQQPLAAIESGQIGRYGGFDPTDGGQTRRDILSGQRHAADEAGYARASSYLARYHLQLWSDFTIFAYRNPLLGCAQIAANLQTSFALPGHPPGWCPLAPSAASPTDQFSQFEDRSYFGGQLVRGWYHTVLGHEAATEAGVQLRRDVIDVGLQDTQARQAFYTVSDDHVGESSAGFHAQSTVYWADWLRSIAGAREDVVDLRSSSRVIAQNGGTASARQVSPKLSLIFGPWARTEFFANIGRGFHSNDARGVIDKLDPTTGQAAAPVPALAAAVGKEAGLRTEAIPGLQSSLALWSLNSASELVYNADADMGSTQANGASRRYGVEWNNHLVARRWLLLDADLAWSHARFAQMNANGASGDQIPNAVPVVGIFRASVQDLGPWSGGVEARYIGAYPLTQDGTRKNPAALVTNLRIQRKLTPDVELGLDVLNVLDRAYFDIAYQQDYQTTATGPYVSNAANAATVHPGEPREFRLTLRVRL